MKLKLLPITFLYLSGFLYGLILVSFPATSDFIIRSFAISKEIYGLSFIPVVLGGVLGSWIGSSLKSLKLTLVLALILGILSQIALLNFSTAYAFPLLMTGMLCVGFGFGLSGPPLNTYPGIFFETRQETALVFLHTLIGIGLASGPLIFSRLPVWEYFPIGIILLSTICLVGIVFQLRDIRKSTSASSGQKLPLTSKIFWAYASAAVIYALGEATFANWCIVFLQQNKALTKIQAANVLSIFWFAVAGGRLLISALLTRLSAWVIWLSLPLMIAGALLTVVSISSPETALIAYALAGLGCSGFFPLTVNLACKRFPDIAPLISATMTAALLVGTGVASYSLGIFQNWVGLIELFQYSIIYPVLMLILCSYLFFDYRQSQKSTIKRA